MGEELQTAGKTACSIPADLFLQLCYLLCLLINEGFQLALAGNRLSSSSLEQTNLGFLFLHRTLGVVQVALPKIYSVCMVNSSELMESNSSVTEFKTVPVC
jgi:hypothetical protein